MHVNTNNIVMWVILQNNADRDCFQDSDFAGDLDDSKCTSRRTLCIFGSHTFVNKLDVKEKMLCLTVYQNLKSS